MTLATITTFQGRLAEDPVKLEGTVRRAAFVVLVNRRTKVENDGGTEEWVDKDTTGHVVKAFNRIAEGVVADTVGKSIRRRRRAPPPTLALCRQRKWLARWERSNRGNDDL